MQEKQKSEIVNKVDQSGLTTIDMEEWYLPGERVVLDMKFLLFQELILKEKDFREFIKNEDWSKYHDKYVAITCSADAIVPTWAFMLLAGALKGHARDFIFGDLRELETYLYRNIFSKVNWQDYESAKVVVKGCSNKPIPEAVYVDLMNNLLPFAKSIMFGEPCSTVPLFKKKDGGKSAA